MKQQKRTDVELCQILAIQNIHLCKLKLNDIKPNLIKKYISIKYYFL